jgi:uncharacterized spore protein YtfJ
LGNQASGIRVYKTLAIYNERHGGGGGGGGELMKLLFIVVTKTSMRILEIKISLHQKNLLPPSTNSK